MTLDENIIKTINQNLNTTIGIYEEVGGNPDKLQKWISQYAGTAIEDQYAFVHGHILGDLQGQAHATARTLLGRALNDEEIMDLVDITRAKRNMVSEVVDAMKRV